MNLLKQYQSCPPRTVMHRGDGSFLIPDTTMRNTEGMTPDTSILITQYLNNSCTGHKLLCTGGPVSFEFRLDGAKYQENCGDHLRYQSKNTTKRSTRCSYPRLTLFLYLLFLVAVPSAVDLRIRLRALRSHSVREIRITSIYN